MIITISYYDCRKDRNNNIMTDITIIDYNLKPWLTIFARQMLMRYLVFRVSFESIIHL